MPYLPVQLRLSAVKTAGTSGAGREWPTSSRRPRSSPGGVTSRTWLPSFWLQSGSQVREHLGGGGSCFMSIKGMRGEKSMVLGNHFTWQRLTTGPPVGRETQEWCVACISGGRGGGDFGGNFRPGQSPWRPLASWEFREWPLTLYLYAGHNKLN